MLSLCYAQQVRHIETINESWDFYKGSLKTHFQMMIPLLEWDKVTIPHSWNTEDILDDEDGYYRGDGWYKKTISIPRVYDIQKVFLLFEGANQVTSLYVNGNSVGRRSYWWLYNLCKRNYQGFKNG